jgi:formylglycine-generating enzyme required for sulfatase activity
VSNPPTPPPPRSDPVPADGDTGQPPHDTVHPAGAASADPDLRPGGRPVPEYTLLVKLGEGGFGQVWKGRDDNGFEVALKFLRLDVRTGAAEQRALEVMKNVRHPHVLPMFRSWQVGSWLVLALELGDKTLYNRLAEAEKDGHVGIPRPELLEYLLESAKGLDYLHTLNIQHRDVKPQNLLLVGGSVKVADFGLAKFLEQSLASNSGAMTPAYAAPEQIQGVLSSQSDQYSLAVSYCQLRGGRLPFGGGTHQVLFGHIQNPPDLSMLPEAERPAVARALAKPPEDRWPSCRAFVDALAPEATAGQPADVAATLATTVLYRQRRTKWYAVGGLLVLAAVVAAGVAIRQLAPGRDAVPPAGPGAMTDAGTPAPDHGTGDKPIKAPEPRPTERPPTPAAKEKEPLAVLHLQLPEAVALRAGGEVRVPVRVRRENYGGRVGLALAGLPAGVQCSPVFVAASEESAVLTLSAATDAPAGDGRATLTALAGSLKGEGRFRITVMTEEVRQRPQPLDCTGPDGVSATDMRKAQETWARYLGRKVEETVEIADGVTMTFVLVPPGKFRMGSPEGEADRRTGELLHEVTLSDPFYLGKYEVTQDQYQALIGSNPSQFKGADKPVEQVEWLEADGYCRKLTADKADKHVYRLPTEAEWEYSCRGGRPVSKPFGIGDGQSLSSQEANFDGTHPYGRAEQGPYLKKTCKVGSYAPNALGLYDMHGNVWEWCADWHGEYPSVNVQNPMGAANSYGRVIRGGSWCRSARICRSAFRLRDDGLPRDDGLGFRVARSVPSGKQ